MGWAERPQGVNPVAEYHPGKPRGGKDWREGALRGQGIEGKARRGAPFS